MHLKGAAGMLNAEKICSGGLLAYEICGRRLKQVSQHYERAGEQGAAGKNRHNQKFKKIWAGSQGDWRRTRKAQEKRLKQIQLDVNAL